MDPEQETIQWTDEELGNTPEPKEEIEEEIEGDELPSDEQEEDSEENEYVDDELEGDEEEPDDTLEEEIDEKDYQEISENMKKAMKSERTKRQEVAAQLQTTAAERDSHKQRADSSDQKFDDLVSQLKELELDSLVTMPQEQVVDPRLEKLLQEQEASNRQTQIDTFYSDMQTVVADEVGGYSNIDVSSETQGTVLTQMVTQAVIQGMDVNEAVAQSLELLDSMLEGKVSTYKKTRQPQVKPRRKNRAATKARASTSQERRSKEMNEGNFKGFFNDFGKTLVDGE